MANSNGGLVSYSKYVIRNSEIVTATRIEMTGTRRMHIASKQKHCVAVGYNQFGFRVIFFPGCSISHTIGR